MIVDPQAAPRAMVTGLAFANKIDENIETAEIILLLVSSDFLGSDYCNDIEVKYAMQRQAASEARVIPVILQHYVWLSAPFGKLMSITRDGKPVTDR